MTTKTAIVSIEDLTDTAATDLAEAFRSSPGVTEVEFSVERQVAVIEFDPTVTHVDALMRIILGKGFKIP